MTNSLTRMEKPTQYLPVGLPFSGKTTLSKELEKRLGFARVNLDEVKFKFGHEGKSDDDVTQEEWTEIFNETDKLVVEHLKAGRNVINETSWTKRWKRDRARKLATDLGLETKVIFVNVPVDVIRDRFLKNRLENDRFDIPDEILESAIQEFEIPTENENILIYDQKVPLEEWIKENFK